MRSRDQGALDGPILSQGTNQAGRGSRPRLRAPDDLTANVVSAAVMAITLASVAAAFLRTLPVMLARQSTSL